MAKAKQSSESSVTFFLHTRQEDKRKKGLIETTFDNMESLYEAKRKAEADGTFVATGAYCN